jgi:hypothetical protein
LLCGTMGQFVSSLHSGLSRNSTQAIRRSAGVTVFTYFLKRSLRMTLSMPRGSTEKSPHWQVAPKTQRMDSPQMVTMNLSLIILGITKVVEFLFLFYSIHPMPPTYQWFPHLPTPKPPPS